MNAMKCLFVSSLLISTLSFAANKPAMGKDAQAVDAACTQDAATAKCTGEQVGTGLLKCLHAYKKANPGFKFSAGCKTAMQTMREDHKAKKAGN